MPALSDGTARTIAVAPSAPLELMWVMHFAEATHSHEGTFASLELPRHSLGPRLTSLRADGVRQLSTEMVVLAHRSGTLLDLDLHRFFNRFDQAVEVQSPLPSLRSESQEERRITAERLERLRSDRDHRMRYVELLRELWGTVEDEWEREGRAATVARAERWGHALRDGTPYRRLLETTSLWAGRPEVDAFADAAAGAGNLILNPCWFGGKIHLLELDGLVYVGRGIRIDETSYRKVAAEISSSLKALADPTRLAILLRLARDPASVTEIARQFQLSQPTVSAHVQVLREAGLLDEKVVGRSARLSATQEGLRRLFSHAEESLLKLYCD